MSYTELTKDVSYRWTHNKTMKDDYDMKLSRALIEANFPRDRLDFDCKHVLLKYEDGRLNQPTRQMIQEANNYYRKDAPTFLGRDKVAGRDASGTGEGEGLGEAGEAVDKSGTKDIDATGRGNDNNGGGEQGQGGDVSEDDGGGKQGRDNDEGGEQAQQQGGARG